MKLRFVTKRFEKRDGYAIYQPAPAKEVVASTPKKAKSSAPAKQNNKKAEKPASDMMNEMEKIATAEEVMATMAPEVKVVKKERGLIERTESSKIILTEDNRQVLND